MRLIALGCLATLSVAVACGPEPEPIRAPQPAPPAPSVALTPAPSTPAATASRTYPSPPRGEVIDDLHGVKVPDPWRPLEELDAPATRAWIDAENQITDRALSSLPVRAALHDRIAALSAVSKTEPPAHRGGRWFWNERAPQAGQRVLYVAASPDAAPRAPRALVDPNVLWPDGSIAYAGMVPSDDGRLVAYGMAPGGGDWQTWKLRRVDDGVDLPDTLSGIKYYAPAFTPDGKGVYYSRFPEPAAGRALSETDHDCKVWFHAVGTPATADVVVYERPDHPTWQMEPFLLPDGKTLVVVIGDGEVGDRGRERVVAIDVARNRREASKPRDVVADFDAEYVYAGGRGSTAYFVTTASGTAGRVAEKKRVVASNLAPWDLADHAGAWREIVPEGGNAIEGVALVGASILVTTLEDAHSVVTAYDLDGRHPHVVEGTGVSTVAVAPGRPGEGRAYLSSAGYARPSSVVALDLATWKMTPWRAPPLAFDPAAFETTLGFAHGKDGTKVPVFVTTSRGAAHDGRRPTLLTGYGGFGVSFTPRFDPAMIAWMERGGAFAVAILRGGGEYGEAWHRAATLEHKQRSFDDFIAASEWLVSSGLTSPAHLGIVGRSGGGALVATVEMQRPDLYAAVAPLAGVHDLVRFPLFGQGAGWQGDWGSPEVPSQLAALLAYSPVHNVKPGTRYPATYIVTADHDARVAPLHSYKLAAALQAAQAGDAPILLRVETQSGHGGGTTVRSRVDQAAEELAFFEWRLSSQP